VGAECTSNRARVAVHYRFVGGKSSPLTFETVPLRGLRQGEGIEKCSRLQYIKQVQLLGKNFVAYFELKLSIGLDKRIDAR
jgi:hypothetical protein